jgi:hypothetical protein
LGLLSSLNTFSKLDVSSITHRWENMKKFTSQLQLFVSTNLWIKRSKEETNIDYCVADIGVNGDIL